MKEDKISFSIDKKLTLKTINESSRLAEAFFHMESKPDEIPANKDTKLFFLNSIPECDNIIYAGEKVIGFALIIPANKIIMNQFLSKKITERELFEKVKKEINYEIFNTIYLCSCFVKKEYRGKGLAVQAWRESILKIIGKRKVKPILFVWTQTKEGENTAKKVASNLKFPLKIMD